MKPSIFWIVPVSLVWIMLVTLVSVAAQSKLDFHSQVKSQPSVVLILRSVCSEATPAPLTSNCTGLELYSLSFSDGTTRVLIGLPDDGTISKNAKWTQVPITGIGSGVGLGQVK